MENQRVIYPTDDGGVAVVVPAPDATLEQVLKAVPAGKPYKVVSVDDVPSDRTFRNAWGEENRMSITINIVKAKSISHDKRRAARAAEFAPLDIKATIPAEAAAAETARQAVREKYATIQTQIDAAADVGALKTIVEGL